MATLDGVLIADDATAFVAACEAGARAARRTGSAGCPRSTRMLADHVLGRDVPADGGAGRRGRRQRRRVPPPAAAGRLRQRPGARQPYDYLIVGAGFAGSVLAERLAGVGQAGASSATGAPISPATPTTITTRPASWSTNTARTSSTPTARRSSTICRASPRWRPYEHRVLASVGDKLLPMPINRTTLNGLYGLDLARRARPQRFLAARAEPVDEIRTSRDVVVSQVGTRSLPDLLRRLYAQAMGPRPVASSTSRSPRACRPAPRPTIAISSTPSRRCRPTATPRMFENMLDHPTTSDVETRRRLSRPAATSSWRRARSSPARSTSIFDHRFGALPYRSLDFRHETLDQAQFQPVPSSTTRRETCPTRASPNTST